MGRNLLGMAMAFVTTLPLSAVFGEAPAVAADTPPISIVAAQNFYGDIAAQIGGDGVVVTSILDGPAGDPHAFEITPSTARAVSEAAIVVFNGAQYDHWMDHLLAATPSSSRVTIEAAALVGASPGDNPHLWYAPETAGKVAGALADALVALDPGNREGYRARQAAFAASLAAIDVEVAAIRARHLGEPVTATEPVFGPMVDALGLAMRNTALQRAILNETEPSARDIAAFEDDLRGGRVRVLFHNAQVAGRLSDHFRAVAADSGVAVVEVSETMPPGTNFQGWMLGQLDAVAAALAPPVP